MDIVFDSLGWFTVRLRRMSLLDALKKYWFLQDKIMLFVLQKLANQRHSLNFIKRFYS